VVQVTDVKIVQDAAGEFIIRGKYYEGVLLEDRIYILQFLRFDSYPAFCWLMKNKMAQPSSYTTTKHFINKEPRNSNRYSR
jgi:hypothetical protein